MQPPHENTAINFANLLIEQRFSDAFALLSTALQSNLGLFELEKTYLNMIGYFKTPPNHIEMIEALSDWPGKLSSDVAWVYVSIDNNNTDAEAVSVTLESNSANAKSQVTIRAIEWGRP